MSEVDRARRAREQGDGRTWRERAEAAEAERDRHIRLMEEMRSHACYVCFDERDRLRLRLSFMEASEVTLQADNTRLRDALGYMANYNMTGTERTLHIDFQGKARAALAGEDT